MRTQRRGKPAPTKSKSTRRTAKKAAPARLRRPPAPRARRGAQGRGNGKANGAHRPHLEKSVRELVYRTCLALDRMDFNAYMALCHPDFRYVISTFSPELRKDIVWLSHDYKGMKTLFDVLPKHVSDNYLRMTLSRHATVYTVDYDDGRGQANVVSGLQVFVTDKDGGETQLFGVAKFYDTVALDGDGGARLLRREVRLDTRQLGETGSHIPF